MLRVATVSLPIINKLDREEISSYTCTKKQQLFDAYDLYPLTPLALSLFYPSSKLLMVQYGSRSAPSSRSIQQGPLLLLQFEPLHLEKVFSTVQSV